MRFSRTGWSLLFEANKRLSIRFGCEIGLANGKDGFFVLKDSMNERFRFCWPADICDDAD